MSLDDPIVGFDQNIYNRIANTEKAIFALVAIIEDTLPHKYMENVNTMMLDYFDAHKSLGAVFTPKFNRGHIHQESTLEGEGE